MNILQKYCKIIIRMYSPMYRKLHSADNFYNQRNLPNNIPLAPQGVQPRKLNFPSIININKINEPVEGLTEKIEDLSYPFKQNGEKYDDDELGVVNQKETASYVNLRKKVFTLANDVNTACLLYTSPSPRDLSTSRMPSSA